MTAAMDSYNRGDEYKGWTGVVRSASGLVSAPLWEFEAAMAGKFLLIDEAALRLGVSADEIHRLVEKKKLFPLRDGTTLKFKAEEIDRLAAAGPLEDEPETDTLEIDLDDAAPAAAAESAVAGQSSAQADSLVLDGSGPLAGDLEAELSIGDAIPREGAVAARQQPGDDDLAQTMLGTAGAFDGLDAMELDLDSVVGLSSPSVAAPAKQGQPTAEGGAGPADSGPLAIGLSGVGIGSQPSDAAGSNATGSLVLGSGPLGSAVVGSDVDPAASSGSLTDAGAALSGALDSGLSLEDDDAAVSGIDLGPLDAGPSTEDGLTELAGDEFNLGQPVSDDDSASVVAVEPESGESSFFQTDGGESSEFGSDIPLGGGEAVDVGELVAGDVVPDIKFSVWQISGLVCCALLLLTGGFVMFDLMRTIGSPDDLSLSSPLLNPLSSVFGWR